MGQTSISDVVCLGYMDINPEEINLSKDYSQFNSGSRFNSEECQKQYGTTSIRNPQKSRALYSILMVSFIMILAISLYLLGRGHKFPEKNSSCPMISHNRETESIMDDNHDKKEIEVIGQDYIFHEVTQQYNPWKDIPDSEDAPRISLKHERKDLTNLTCRPENFRKWNQQAQFANPVLTKDKYRLERVPYPQLILVQTTFSTSPSTHYEEMVAYLKQEPAKKVIYIEEAPLYAALLVAAVTPPNVTIIYSSKFFNQTKELLRLGLQYNGIRNRIIFDKEMTKQNFEAADLVITTSPILPKLNQKRSILLVEWNRNPIKKLYFESVYRLQSVETCLFPEFKPYADKQLTKGIYLIKPTCGES